MAGYRRVVSYNDKAGVAKVLFDSAVEPQTSISHDFTLCDLWETNPDGTELTGANETIDRPYGVCDKPGQTMFKIVKWPTERAVREDPAISAAFNAMLEDRLGETNRDEVFRHATHTVDYLIVLDGEISCLLDEGEVTLKAGDTMVQRGTRHGWVNRGDIPCTIACVMIGV